MTSAADGRPDHWFQALLWFLNWIIGTVHMSPLGIHWEVDLGPTRIAQATSAQILYIQRQSIYTEPTHIHTHTLIYY